MTLRTLSLGLVVGLTLLVASGYPLAFPQDPPPLIVSGRVDIVTGPYQTLLVLVDQGTAAHPADGVVDLAFRLQRAPSLSFSGYATVTYVKNRVAVVVDDQTGWVFTVAGRVAQAVQAEALPHHDVLGLSRFWGPSVNTTPTALAVRLLAGGCGTALLDTGGPPPQCDPCLMGGPGWTSCSVFCGEDTCGAECAGDQYACCNCPLGCGCCPVKPGGGQAK